MAALLSLCVGVILLWWATTFDQPWSTVIGALATLVVTLGVGNGYSNLILQRHIARDLMELVNSNRQLVAAGVDGLIRLEDVKWDDLFSSAEKIECAVLNPSQFRHQIWPRILEASRGDLRSIELVFVDTGESRATHETAGRFNMSTEAYARLVDEVRGEIEKQWKAQRTDRRSTLTVRLTTKLPHYAYIETPRANAILLDPMSRETGFDYTHLLQFRTNRHGVRHAEWLTESIAALRSTFSAPVYSDAPKSTEPIGNI